MGTHSPVFWRNRLFILPLKTEPVTADPDESVTLERTPTLVGKLNTSTFDSNRCSMDQPNRPRLTAKALLVGAILIPLNAVWQMIGLRWDIAHMSMISLLYNTVTLLFLMTVWSRLTERIVPSLSFSRADLLAIYTMVSLSTAIGGHMCMQMLPPIISYAFAYNSPENDWQALFWHYIPDWTSVRDRNVARNFFTGQSTLYTPERLQAWLSPLVIWALFLLALFLVMLSINFLVRKQWIEHEKLSYPLIQLPLLMTNRRSNLLGNKLMWIGFTIAASIDLSNGLNDLYPSWPRIAGIRGHDISRLFTTRPWDAIDWLPFGIYPFAVGLAFFMPLDLSFSCWFFYLFWKLQQVFGRSVGFEHDFPYPHEQSFGAYVGLGLSAIWISRRHLSQIVSVVFSSSTTIDQSQEPFHYRSTVLMAGISLIFLFVFCYQLGMSIWVILIFFCCYYALAIGVTRMRAELGSPVHDQHWCGPDHMMYMAFGTRRLGPQNLTALSYLYFFNRSYDCLLMPHQLEGLKIAEQAKIENRKFAGAILLAISISLPITIWAYMHMSYRDGVYTGWVGRESFSRLNGWLNNPLKANVPALTASGIGLLVAFLLTMMRARFFWFPFHAAGYAVTSTYTMNFFWFSIWISFVIKSICLKQGGLKFYRQAIPFFLGLVLGEFVVTTFWGTLAMILQRQTYITIDL